MELTYKKLKDCKDYQIIIDNKMIGMIEHNTAYKRFPYTISMEHKGRLVSHSGHDCFSTLTIAKKEIKDSLNREVK